MATTTTRTTQLEAVNTMLSTIGESPVNSLTGSLPLDASIAVNILNEVNREVQSAGWKFNTSWKVSLPRDVNNKLVVGTDVLHIEFNHLRESKSSYDPVLRGNYLYNLAKESYTWDKDFEYVTVIYLLDFETIPDLPYELVDFKKYYGLNFDSAKPSITMITSRGCPYTCGFCAIPVLYKRSWKALRPEMVIERLKYMEDKYGIKDFYLPITVES